MTTINYLRDKYVTPMICDLCSNIAEDRKLTCEQAVDLMDMLKDWLGEGAKVLDTPIMQAEPKPTITPPPSLVEAKPTPRKGGRGHKPGTRLGPQLKTIEREKILDEVLVLCDVAAEAKLDKVVIKPEDVGVEPSMLRRASRFFVPYFVQAGKSYALARQPVYGVAGLTVFLRK